ncbi:MAG: glycosyltransferase [Phycisphaerales bacterium]|nr:glycosyltransferase [Phycisphaerales bacterium]
MSTVADTDTQAGGAVQRRGERVEDGFSPAHSHPHAQGGTRAEHPRRGSTALDDCAGGSPPHPSEPPILADRAIVCIASDYDFDPTGKHHIMRELARSNRVLWVNYHGSRRPRATGSDAGKALRTLLRAARGASAVRPGMMQVTPIIVPGARSRLFDRINRALLVRQLRAPLESLCAGRSLPVQVWSFAPDTAFLRGAFNEEALVYYCVDEFSQFEGYDPSVVARKEVELLRCADVVFASSEELALTKRHHRGDVHLVRHGVEYDHFAQAWRSPWPCPADLADWDTPIFGFFGLIQHWVDVELIAAAARLRPQYAFALLGEARTDVSLLEGLPNVRLLGRRPYGDLPAYCARFSAGLLPFKRNELTRNVNPIKLREYLAAGLPVISTALPEVERYAPHARIIATPEELARACDALACPPDRHARERLSRRMADESWPSVVRELSRVVVKSMAPRTTHRDVLSAPDAG